MSKPRIAIVSFPGNNCEVESIRAINRTSMEAVYCRWNESIDQFENIDGYFLPGGFSYEDRGRAGMVAARDPILAHIAEEAAKGKPVVGNCNGAQILIETGLIPLGEELTMSLARNAIDGSAAGFLNEWIWITPTCAQERCATSDWKGVMQIPIAHGEGRFTTRDADLYKELQKNDQIAFCYCDAEGNVSKESPITPNGSEYAIAGVCNPEGNVVALMPHPERTFDGDPYFQSLKQWIETHTLREGSSNISGSTEIVDVPKRASQNVEIFIDTIIVDNEERTVEQTAKKLLEDIVVKQLRYFSLQKDNPSEVLSRISLFNPNKEVAYIRRNRAFSKWNPATKTEEVGDSVLEEGTTLLRRDEPDTGSKKLREGSQTGVCYVCSGVNKEQLLQKNVMSIFGNPHSSTMELL